MSTATWIALGLIAVTSYSRPMPEERVCPWFPRTRGDRPLSSQEPPSSGRFPAHEAWPIALYAYVGDGEGGSKV